MLGVNSFSEKAVKKTVTIPVWLNYKAEAAGVNFSQEQCKMH